MVEWGWWLDFSALKLKKDGFVSLFAYGV